MDKQASECVFCRIGQGTIPAQVHFQDEYMLIIQDIHPQAPVHWLAIPRAHFSSIAEASDPNLLGRILVSLSEFAREHQVTDYRLVINRGREAGQTVFHLHIHLLAGRPMHWPPG